MPRFIHRTRIEAPAADVFDWHTRPGAFERLLPPWESVEIVERTGGIRDGDRVTLRSRVGPAWTRWVVEHRDYVEGVQFRDVQISGPFRRWEHTHRVVADGAEACTLEDDILYELPLGSAGKLLGAGMIESKLQRMFNFRHSVTRADVLAHCCRKENRAMRVVVTGSTGLIGSNLMSLLTTGGHDAVSLTRHPKPEGSKQAHWAMTTGQITLSPDEPVDAVVHLAGENIAGRWSREKKRLIMDSRVNGTRQIVDWMNQLDVPPRVFVCASAIGLYGNRGDKALTENSERGTGFLADVCAAWEAEAIKARSDNTRVVSTRFGVVMSPQGGALSKMLTPFKMGGGGVVGSGRQYWSWIGVDDAAGAVLHALQCDQLDGPVNVVSPEPVTNREFTKTLGSVLRRPTVMPMPAFAARLAFGEMADHLLLGSQRVLPDRLRQTEYAYRHPDLAECLRHLLGKAG
ncbi:MAG: TIGR01777 family oxidoreductase [Planctomycetota bacterium]|jgi:uncharacterized protein (TIGR01777 family)